MKVYPVPGLLLRDPEKGDFVPVEGREVADSPFWRRRLRDKDATLVPPVAAAATVAQVAATAADDGIEAPAEQSAGDTAETAPADADGSETEGAV